MKRTLLLSSTLVSVALLGAPLVRGRAGEIVFIAGTALLPVLLAALGAARRGRLGRVRWALTALALVLVACLLGLLALAGGGGDARLFGLPPAAALQILGLVGLPLVLVSLAYGLTFDEHGVDDVELERLRALRSGEEDSA